MNDVFLLETPGAASADVTLGELVTVAAPGWFTITRRRWRPAPAPPPPPPPERQPVVHQLHFAVAGHATATAATVVTRPVDWDAEAEELFALGLWEVPVGN